MLQYCNSTGASSWGKRRRGTKIGLVCWNWMGSMHQPSALIGKWTLTNLNKSATKWPAFKASTWDEMRWDGMRVRNHWELKAESYLFYFVFFLFFLQFLPMHVTLQREKQYLMLPQDCTPTMAKYRPTYISLVAIRIQFAP